MTDLPKTGSTWRYTKGGVYTVVLIANEHTAHPREHPVTIVYKGRNERVWCLTLAEWRDRMTFICNPPLPPRDLRS